MAQGLAVVEDLAIMVTGVDQAALDQAITAKAKAKVMVEKAKAKAEVKEKAKVPKEGKANPVGEENERASHL